MKATKLFLISAFPALLIAACSSENKADYNNTDSQTAQNQTQSAANQTLQKEEKVTYKSTDYPFDFNGKPLTIAGIRFTPATQWEDLGAADMRAATYKFGPLESDTSQSELAVYYFGQGQGGSIEANQQRWIKQMSMPDGRDPATAAIKYTMQANGMNAHVLTLFGTFNEPVGGMMSGKTIARENYRMVGIIVEAPQGNVFFKLTGPDFTSRVMIEALMPMINQIQKA